MRQQIETSNYNGISALIRNELSLAFRVGGQPEQDGTLCGGREGGQQQLTFMADMTLLGALFYVLTHANTHKVARVFRATF